MTKVNSKVQKAFEKLEKLFIVYPTSNDMEMIKKVMQDMYDLGRADGHADNYFNKMVAEEKVSGVLHNKK